MLPAEAASKLKVGNGVHCLGVCMCSHMCVGPSDSHICDLGLTGEL